MNREQVIAKLKKIKPEIQVRYPVSALALFGSMARNEATESSDIDLMVELNGPIGSRFVELAEELELALNQHVDLVSRAGIKPHYFAALEKELIYV